MIRRRIALLFLPTLLIVLLAGGFAWLLRSESGAQWIWQRVAAAVPGTLQAQRLRGGLQSGLTLEGLRYRDARLALAADRVTLRLDLDFWPPTVAVHDLRVGELQLNSTAATAETPASSAADQLPGLALPVPVEFRRVEGVRVTWSAGAEPQIDIRDLSLSGSWHRRLVLNEARFESGGSRWRVGLELDMQAPHRLEFKAAGAVVLPGRPAGQHAALAELPIRARASGDLQKSQWVVETADPQLTLSGEVRGLLAEPGWNLRLAAGPFDWPPAPAVPELSVHDLVIDSEGTLAAYSLQAEARILGNDIPALQVRMLGTGDRAGVEVERFELAGEAVQLDATGRIDWLPAVSARMDANVSRFDPQPWFAAWNGAAPASGRVALAWSDGRLAFEVLEATAPGTLTALTGAGALDSGGTPAGGVDAELAWQGLVWPPGAAEPRVSSREGRARVGGTLDAWTVAGELELSGPDFPAGRLEVEGTGDRESLSLRVPGGEVLGGTLAGAFDLRWSPDLSWSATARLRNVATAPLTPSLPGRLSGDVAARGRAEPVELEIDIRELAGNVRQRPVSARGRLVLEAGQVQARGLQVRSGGSELTANGHPGAPGGLTVEARIASLADLADGASGAFNGSATLSLRAGRPLLRLDGSGQALSWGATAIGQLALSTGADADGTQATQLELRDIALGGKQIESLTAVASGQRPLERLEVRAKSADGLATLSLAGAVRDWNAPLAGGWRGRLEALRLERAALGSIELQAPAALSLDAAGLTLAQACFNVSPEGRLCLESAWRAGAERTLQASLDGVSPSLALDLLDSDLAFTQRLSGDVDWRQVHGRSPEARVRLDISAGEVRFADDDEDEPLFATGAGLFGFEIADGRLVSGNLDIPLPGGGIDTDFSVPDLSPGLDSPVEGHVRIDLDDIRPVLRLLPPVEGSSGPVTADLRFTGTLGDPRVSGNASLVRGRISHFATGLLLDDLNLSGAVNEFAQTELTGTFRAGEGQGSLRAVVNFADLLQPELLLELRGEQLTVINVPDLTVLANPDVRLTLRPDVLELSGRIVVPSARLSPKFLPTASVDESADVVIVGGQDPQPVAPKQPRGDRRIRGRVELELGKDVLLKFEQATARLRGTAQFRWEDGGPLPVASGGFALTGKITAYGQLLEVTEGRISFSDRPADNPFLNIRAEREIYGNTQVTRAGVLVTGTLKEPELETYTVPMTTRERALTLLVTGSDFNYEQGVGSVQVGMYIAPKLYVSYGIGLFDEQNVISARYDLGKGFGIMTTSGQRETGADISYTIEH
jgi:translocation and assembly module TamB